MDRTGTPKGNTTRPGGGSLTVRLRRPSRRLLWAVLTLLTVPVAGSGEVLLHQPSRLLARQPSRLNDCRTYLGIVRTLLKTAGLTYHTVDDEALMAGAGEAGDFVVFGYSPLMDDEVTKAVGRFLDRGGRALFCYYLPDAIRRRMGIGELVYTAAGTEELFDRIVPADAAPAGMPEVVVQRSWNAYVPQGVTSPGRVAARWLPATPTAASAPALILSPEAAWLGHVFTEGDAAAKARLLLSVLGAYDADVWRRALPSVLRGACAFRFARTPAELVAFAKGGPRALSARLVADGLLALESGAPTLDPATAYQRATAMRGRAENAYLHSFPARTDQLRGAWVVSPRGVSDWGWEWTARQAKRASLDALFVRVAWGGQARYPSDVLLNALAPGDDPLREAAAACHRHGLALHAWFINLNWRQPPRALVEQFARDQRWQCGPDGKPPIREGRGTSYWLNPAHPDNVKLQAEMMAEVARKYAVDGVHFDYIRYENFNGSYGSLDRRAFERWLGRGVGRWPEDVRPEGAVHDKFAEWRCLQVDNVVRRAAEAVRAVRPDCRLSAAVYPSWPAHRLLVGQDWVHWLNEGWVDFVCPMTYDSPSYTDRHFDRVGRQREAAGKKPLYVGLGAWLHPNAVALAEQIHRDRQLGADGFVLFSLGESLLAETLPDLQKGVFAGDRRP